MIYFYHGAIGFSKRDYIVNAHHYLKDERVSSGQFSFLRSLGAYDAQWYLKIAEKGFPKNPKVADQNNKAVMDGLSYAFFPLYPIVLSLFNKIFRNIEFSAFMLSNLIMILNFGSLYYVIGRALDRKTAVRTALLLFVFPFGIFFRSYFAEGLFLFFLIWFGHFLIKKKWVISSLFLGALSVTKPMGLFLFPVFYYFFLKEKKINYKLFAKTFLTGFVPLLAWCVFNYLQTGSFIYFYSVQSQWSGKIFSIVENIGLLLFFPYLPFHDFHFSKVEDLVIVLGGIIIFFSRKKIPKEWWFLGLALWLGRLLTSDTMSFSRHQSINFPLFLFAAMKLKGVYFWFVLGLFYLSLLIASLYFVNWYWVG